MLRKVVFSFVLILTAISKSQAGELHVFKSRGANALAIHAAVDEAYAKAHKSTNGKKSSLLQLSCQLANGEESKQVICVALFDFKSHGVVLSTATALRLIRAIPLTVQEQYLKTDQSSVNLLEIENITCEIVAAKSKCVFSAFGSDDQ